MKGKTGQPVTCHTDNLQANSGHSTSVCLKSRHETDINDVIKGINSNFTCSTIQLKYFGKVNRYC